MVQRKTYPIDDRCEIVLAIEEMSEGAWAVVASIRHRDGDAERVVDLPVPSQRFPSAAEAETFGLDTAYKWIQANIPRAA